jgi:hypothetical protein
MAERVNYQDLVCVGSKKSWYNPTFFMGDGVGLKNDLGFVGQKVGQTGDKTALRILHVDTPPSLGSSTSRCTLNKTLDKFKAGDVATVPTDCLQTGEVCLNRTTAIKDVIEKGWVSVPRIPAPAR